MFQSNYCGVYAITSRSTAQSYVGSSQNMVSRQARHLKDLRAGRHHNKPLQLLYATYGESDLEFSVLQICSTREEAYNLEAEILTRLPGLLNVGRSVRGGDNLTKNPDRADICRRVSETLRQMYVEMTPEERSERFGRQGPLNGMYGKTHSPEARQVLSRFHAGNQYAVGSVRSPEHRQVLSDLAKLRTGEANAFFGRQHSTETKARIAATKTAQPGVQPSTSKRLFVDGQHYPSIRAAITATGVSRYIIKRRLADPAYPNYTEEK